MYQRKNLFLTILLISALTIYRQQFFKTDFVYFKQFLNNLNFSKNVEAQVSIPQQNQELQLTILNLKDNDIVHNRILTFNGTTAPNSDIFINQSILKANINGGFSARINLDEGQNKIVIVANDDNGNYIERELAVFLETLAP